MARWCGFACSPRFLREQAAGAAGRALLRPPSRAPRSRRGEGRPSPLSRGRGGRRPRDLRAGGGGGGGRAAAPPSLPLGGGPRFPTLPPLSLSAHSPRRARSVGVAGPPRAPAAACLAGGGEGEGRPVNRSRGGPVRRQALPPPSPGGQRCGCLRRSLAMAGAAPILLWFVAACRPRAWSARRSGALVRARLPAATPAGAGGGGRWGALRVGPAAPPPLRVAVPSGGGGVSPRLRGGGGSALLRPVGRGGSGGGGGVAAPPLPAPLPRRVSACDPSAPARPPRGIPVPWGWPGGRGRRTRPGRPPVGQCGGGGGREGGSDLLALVRAPAFPSPASEWAALLALSWAPPFCGRSVAGNAGACGRFTGGAWRAAALAAAAVSPPWVRPPPRGGAGPLSLRSAFVRSWAGGGGGEGAGLWSPDAVPQRPPGGGPAVPAPGGQPSAGGAHSSPAPVYPVRAGPSCKPLLGLPAPPAVVARRWLAGGGREGQPSAVSGLRGSGLPPALVVPAPPPAGSGASLFIALYRGGGVGRRARLCRRGRPAALPPPPLSRARRLGRHLRRRLCGGRGCGGGRFRRQ